MARRRLIWKLLPAYAAATLLAVVAAGWYATGAVHDLDVDRNKRELAAWTALARGRFTPELLAGPPEALAAACRALDRDGGMRVTVIAPDGRVLADSERDARGMENHATRPEVREALAGRPGSAIRFSDTLRADLLYLAEPLAGFPFPATSAAATATAEPGAPPGTAAAVGVGVLRTAMPLAVIDRRLRAVYARLAIGGAILTAVAAGLGLLIFTRLVGRPLEAMKRSAFRFAGGDLAHAIPPPDSEELGGLADALNRMAAQLDEKISTITRQSHERQAVLSSMIEAVVAVDTEARVLSLNHAAAALLGVDPARAVGRRLREVLRHTQFQRFVEQGLAGGEPLEGDLVLPAADAAAGDGEPAAEADSDADAAGDRYLQAHSTVLRDAAGRSIGALVVLNDVTRLRRLENVRRDFVANVSHELKTPVTSIKGFIETLRDGAVHEPETAEQFLGIIARQADRLSAIIDDLLKLSRIEREGERAEVELAPHRLRDVLQSALGDCQAQAAERRVSLRLSCPEGLTARVNAPLLEQAVVNLLDNAIKYSEPGGVVEVEASVEDTLKPRPPRGGVRLAETDAPAAADAPAGAAATGAAATAWARIGVRDHGCGIPAEHLPRLFERFYRVDKARSRKQGGTGLGLAIVKHIAQAHRGGVSVTSTPGKGSTFTLRLPAEGISAATLGEETARALPAERPRERDGAG